MSPYALFCAIRSSSIFNLIVNPKVKAYNAAYRNYRKFQALEAHELRDMGITVHEQKSQKFGDFIDAHNRY